MGEKMHLLFCSIWQVPKPTQYQEPSVESPPQVLNDFPANKKDYPTVKISNSIGYVHRQKRSTNETLLG